jgi:hypothetical protein
LTTPTPSNRKEVIQPLQNKFSPPDPATANRIGGEFSTLLPQTVHCNSHASTAKICFHSLGFPTCQDRTAAAGRSKRCPVSGFTATSHGTRLTESRAHSKLLEISSKIQNKCQEQYLSIFEITAISSIMFTSSRWLSRHVTIWEIILL